MVSFCHIKSGRAACLAFAKTVRYGYCLTHYNILQIITVQSIHPRLLWEVGMCLLVETIHQQFSKIESGIADGLGF
jgi:hypothetical protein